MSSFKPPYSLMLCVAVILIIQTAPVSAFGAGNIASISAIEGQNWRHGDLEDTLLNILMARVGNGGKKFSKLDVKRVYFGNWLRDYSQAVDVGTVKYVSAEAIRILIWVLGFVTFGYGSGEFQVTLDRLGCYRPEEHIDNPKDYADNIDARQYDRRLRGPVDERRELSINPQTGLKNYIGSENMGIATSAGMLREVFGRCIQLGRQYGRSKNKADFYEALRLLGQGCHCLEDYSAHSNYVETALIELGERDVFPHVGRQTQVNLPGVSHPVYPIVTGTFGGVDFAYSVMGEFGDKATQSEIQELQGTFESSQNSGQNVSVLEDLLKQLPSGLLGNSDQANKVEELQANAQAAQMQNTHISPREPEAWTRQLQEITKQIYPIIEWHDELMKSITEFIEKIPILPDLIDQLQEQVNVFVFTQIAPFVLPIINQVKTELGTGSSEIINSSKEKQHIVFHDDRSSDPTHSMLSKDHFSNLLNEPAGKVASAVLKWVVPQLMACWDDERIDVNRTITRIITGVFHHPVLRDRAEDGASDGRRAMFQVVQQWWSQKDERERAEMRDQLSRDGVEQGRNQKPGVHDTGHGCGKPLGMPNAKLGAATGASSALPIGNILGQINSAMAGQSQYDSGATRPGAKAPVDAFSQVAGQAVGGGAFGGLVGGLVGGVGADLLGDAIGGSNSQKKNYQSEEHHADGSYTQNYTETGYNRPQGGEGGQRYGQAQYSQTSYPEGGQRQEYQRYEQSGGYGQGGYGEQVIQESRPTYGGGYEQTTETRYKKSGNEWQSDTFRQERTSAGELLEERKHHDGDGYKKDKQDSDDDDDSEDSDGRKKSKHKKKHKKHDSESYEGGYQNESYRQEETEGYGARRAEYGGFDSGEGRRVEEPRRRNDEYEGGSMPGGFGGNIYGERRRQDVEEPYAGERPAYGGGGYGGERYGREEQVEERPAYEREERVEEDEGYGGGRGYGGGDEYEERRDDDY
ncbi:hypothetical protein MMC30_005336 [Trapelia coarctata]|nr:hypothetical protein [Trapelia coarctata]